MPAESGSVTDIVNLVNRLIEGAVRARASDIHVEPTAAGFEVRYRIDGMLETAERFDAGTGRGIVSRLMVLAKLLTYRLDIPQEGRAEVSAGGDPLELRVAIMPTTHGLRGAVRLPADLLQPHDLDELHLPPNVLAGLTQFAAGDAGMLIVTGPAGSGKTTTIYALLRHITRTAPGQSIVSLEDPVERDLPGVTQIEVKPFGELTYERSLRSILRQDPQVLMLGEIRDGATAALAMQAALSGHRLICTLHASSPGGAIARLLEMGIEPYQVTSAVFGIASQRLVRRKTNGEYLGRVPVAEFVTLDGEIRSAILGQQDSDALNALGAKQPGFISFREAAARLVADGTTDEAEVQRVLGTGASHFL